MPEGFVRDSACTGIASTTAKHAAANAIKSFVMVRAPLIVIASTGTN
jgi:hypothetical protein